MSTRWCELADRHQFVVAFPEQSLAVNGQRCWNWHQATNPHTGEPGILTSIVRRAIADRRRWRIDPRRVYAVGLSAGGAMATTLGVAHPELFTAIGVHSGPPYRSATSLGQVISAMQGRRLPPAPNPLSRCPLPPTIVIQGTRDATIWPVNAQRIASHWLAYYAQAQGPDGAPLPVLRERITHRKAAVPATSGSQRAATVQRWSVGTQPMLEVWLVEGLGHAWSGGAPKVAYSDRRGPRASTQMWRFFATHRKK